MHATGADPATTDCLLALVAAGLHDFAARLPSPYTAPVIDGRATILGAYQWPGQPICVLVRCGTAIIRADMNDSGRVTATRVHLDYTDEVPDAHRINAEPIVGRCWLTRGPTTATTARPGTPAVPVPPSDSPGSGS